jgi:hypothetical protein
MRSSRIGSALGLVLAMASLPMAGCGASAGDGLAREAVSGKVTLDGQPLKKGNIQFMPSGPDQSTTGSAPIQDGAYSIPQAEGLVAGAYAVRIYSGVGAAATVDELPGEPAPPPKEPIPAVYNAKTTLSAEVVKGKEYTFSFDLKSR